MRNIRPPSVRTDGSNTFARRSMAVRVPSIIRETVVRNDDYLPSVRGALLALAGNIENDLPLTLFHPPAPDHDLWAVAFYPFAGDSWLSTEWLFAELYAYRLE